MQEINKQLDLILPNLGKNSTQSITVEDLCRKPTDIPTQIYTTDIYQHRYIPQIYTTDIPTQISQNTDIYHRYTNTDISKHRD